MKLSLEKLKQSMSRQWWLEPALPVFLAIGIIMALTYILLAGTKRDQLSSAVESTVIRNSVRFASNEVLPTFESIYVVSATDEDLSKLPNSDYGFLRDLSFATYTRITEKLLQNGMKRIYLSWLPSSQTMNLEYVSGIVRLKKKYRDAQILLAYPVEELPFLPKEVTDALDFLEADDCGRRIQTVCSYNEKWENWIVQHIVNTTANDEFRAESNQYISNNLPHFRPNYIMNLPSSSSLKVISASAFLSDQNKVRYKTNDMAFIGPDYKFSDLGRSDKLLVRRTYTSLDDVEKGISTGGTPFHVMWAQIAGMFASKRYVRVAELWQTRIMAVLFCVLLLSLFIRFGAVLALGAFILIGLMLPLADMVLVRYFQFYIPLFEIVYCGLVLLLFASMAFLSFQTYQKWRLDQLALAHSETADLQKNFIAVVSHNLNTPIAQMQGLNDILVLGAKDKEAKEILSFISAQVASMQLFVRSVLIQSSIDSSVLNEQSVSLRSFVAEFAAGTMKTLEKLEIKVRMGWINDDSEWNDIPLPIDTRIFSQVLANILLLLKRRGHIVDVHLSFDNKMEDGLYVIRIRDEQGKNIFDVWREFQKKDVKIVDVVLFRLVDGYFLLKGVKVDGDSDLNIIVPV